MYKTLNRLNVYIHGDENPYTFADDATLFSGTTALSQVKNCRDIDTILNEEGVPTIIPYHAIDNIEVASVRTETEDPVDDNCNTGGSGEPGTLTIINGLDLPVSFQVYISQALDGTYGDLTFTTDDGGEPFPDGYQAFAPVMNLAPGASVTAPGLPYATNVAVYTGTDIPMLGNVPVTLTIGGNPGPGPSS